MTKTSTVWTGTVITAVHGRGRPSCMREVSEIISDTADNRRGRP